MITLYHGSNTNIEKIDLSMSKPDKDFGRGFYLTDLQSQAEEMAVRRCKILETGEPMISRFLFDENILNNNILNVLVFDEPTTQWAKFILNNRQASRNGFHHNYDIIIGPVADDGVAFQLGRYTRGLIDLKTLAQELRYRKLNRQYYFETERSIQYLQKL